MARFGGRRVGRANDNVRLLLDAAIKKLKRGVVFHASKFCTMINDSHRNRAYTPQRVGSLLKERLDLERVGVLWRKR